MPRMPLFVAPLLIYLSACSTVSRESFSPGLEPDSRLFIGVADAAAPNRSEYVVSSEPRSLSMILQGKALGRKPEKRHEFTLSRQRVEFGKVTIGEYDIAGTTFPEDDTEDVQQTLSRFRYRLGGRASGFIVGFIAEKFEDDPSDAAFDLVGIELGSDGFPHLGSSPKVAAAIDYGFSFSARGGDGEIPTLFGNAKTDIVIVELAARIGAGVDIQGLQISGGLTGSAIGAGLNNDIVDDPFEAHGTNMGPYFRVWYRSNSFPLVGGIQLMGGDMRGASFGVGLLF